MEIAETEKQSDISPQPETTHALEVVEPIEPPAPNPHLLTDDDIHLFHAGTHTHLHEKLGAHATVIDGVHGTQFAVWAPNAAEVTVIGDFNDWKPHANHLQPRGNSGIWEAFIPQANAACRYKYHIRSHHKNHRVDKADPFGFYSEIPPKTASIIWNLDYKWHDAKWMKRRARHNALDAPMSIYEVHLGSWMRVPEESNRWLTYREIAPKLADYCKEMGFTHVEFMPLMEHPYYASWGYQTTGYFAPTSRYGSPQDFMFLIDHLHQQGIGVFLDWVPSHFPTDAHGLAYFDGTHLFEHADPRKGYHPDWKSSIFNYGRHEVCSFLLSSAMFWLDKYNADGLRVDAVASMLYLDYSRKPGEWIPNKHGGHDNLEAIAFLRHLNEAVYREHPDVQTIAEESTSWAQVSRPTHTGGLGFGLKWDMGWMHDTLRYLKRNSIHRKYHHGELPFRMIYAFHENFVLPLSHDEVVHGKGSLYGMMSGDSWQKYANLRLLYGYMYGMPGKKLLFMGAELAQWPEWNHERSLEWDVLKHAQHAGIQRWIKDLNHFYKAEAAMHERDFTPDGFEWIDFNDHENSTLFFLRKSKSGEEMILGAFNFTPVPRHNYRIGVPLPGFWQELLNSDAPFYGGSGQGNYGGVESAPVKWQDRPHSIRISLPPLSAVFFRAPAPNDDAENDESATVSA